MSFNGVWLESQDSVYGLPGDLDAIRASITANAAAATAAVEAEAAARAAKDGDLNALSTDAKGNLVSAINEVDSNADTNAANLAQEILDRAADTALSLRKAGGTMSGDIAMGTNKITGLGNGTGLNDAVTVGQLQSAKEGFSFKAPVLVATNTNIDLTVGGLATVDGVDLVEGDRVLVRAQTDAIENGIYEARSGSWVRAVDFDDAPVDEVEAGAETRVLKGAQFKGKKFYVLSAVGSTITVGTDEIVFDYVDTLDDMVAGNGITKVGNEVSIDVVASTEGVDSITSDGSGIKVSEDFKAQERTYTDDQITDRSILPDGSNAFAANQSMGGFALTNVADAVNDGDAVNKGVMDEAIRVGGAKYFDDFLTVAGGKITLPYAPEIIMNSRTVIYQDPTTNEVTRAFVTLDSGLTYNVHLPTSVNLDSKEVLIQFAYIEPA
jgi:hypothetical protein